LPSMLRGGALALKADLSHPNLTKKRQKTRYEALKRKCNEI
jgi:hypothetical protein